MSSNNIPMLHFEGMAHHFSIQQLVISFDGLITFYNII